MIRKILFKDLHFSDAPKMIVDPPGPRARALLERQRKFEGRVVLYPLSIPFVPDESFGATVRDVDGNVYIDFYAGISVVNFGYSNPFIMEVVIKQLKRMVHTLDFPSRRLL